WHRGRVLEKQENICKAFLIDTGQVLVVEETHLASACDVLFQLPPKVVWGVFASILPLGEKWSPKAMNYFSSLVGLQLAGHVKAVLPYQLFILEVPKIINDVLELQLGKRIDGDSFCLIVQILRAFPQEMLPKRVPQLLQQKYPVKELLAFSNSEKPTDFCPVPDSLFPYLSVGSKENVKITVAVSPNKFYCQIQKWQKELEDLTRAMCLYYEAIRTENNKSFDKLGLLCAAKRQNGQWHRGVIKQLLSDCVEVWFMDFGITEAVPDSCVQNLKEDFMTLPMISFPCALSCFDSQNEAVIKSQLKEFIQALIRQTSVYVCVDLYSDVKRLYYITLQNQNFGIKSKHPENLNEAPASRVSLLETKVAHIAVNYKPYDEIHNSFKSCAEDKHTKRYLSEEDISLFTQCKGVEMQKNSFYGGFVVHVTNPSNFWIQTHQYENEFQTLLKNIADVYNRCEADEMVLKNPKPGLLCCARYSKDMHYYRGVVIAVLHVNITVYFLDFGNTDTVPYYDVKTLLPEFSNLPALAMCCTLADIFPVDDVWVKKETDFFKNIVFNRSLLLHVIGKRNNNYIVNMWCRTSSGKKNVARCMTEAGCAIYWKKTPGSGLNSGKKRPLVNPHKLKKEKGNAQRITNVCKNKASRSVPSVLRHCVVQSCFGKGAVPKRCTLVREKKLLYKEFVFEPGSVFEVVCSYFVSPADFSCQLQSKLPELNQLMEQIQTYYKEHVSPYKTGERACVVKCPKDGKWYRATVVQQISTNKVEVVFVDYGYRVRVLLEDLQAILPDFLTLERQAFRCGLKNVPLQTDLLNWSEEAHRRFEEFVSASGGPLTCVICALILISPECLYNIVDLQTPFLSAEEFLRKCGLIQSEYFCLTNFASLGSLYSFCYSSFNIKMASEEEVYITYIYSPSKFYCQLNRNTETVEALMKKVSVISKLSNNAKYDISNMRLCIARYFEDGLFYRALASPMELTSYLCVDFVDFGNKTIVERDQLMPIPDSATDLLFTPMQAIKCCLSDLRETIIPARVTRWFEETFLGKLLKAVIVSRESDGPLVVELYDGQVKVSQKIKEKILEEMAPNFLEPVAVNKGVKCHMEDDKGISIVTLKNTERVKWKTETRCKVYGKCDQADSGQEDDERTACSTQELCSKSSKPGSEELCFRNTIAVLVHGEEPLVGEPVSQSLCHPALNLKEVTDNALAESHNNRLNYIDQQERNNKNIPKLISLPQRDVQVNSEVAGYISHMNSLSSFYIQLAEDENSIKQLAEQLNESMVNIGHENCLNELMVGDLIVAEHDADCFYYRAVIKTLKLGNAFEVEFIDYGNAAVVSSSKICRIQKKFLALPRLSFHCFLSRVKSRSDESWTEKSASHFVSKINNGPIVCKFLRQHGEQWEIDVIYDGRYVESYHIWEVDIFLGDIQLQEYLNQLLNNCQTIAGPEKSSKADCKEFDTSFKISPVTWTLLWSGRLYPGFATAVTDPSNFFIQFEALFDCMKNLSLLLSDLPDDLPALPRDLVAPGVRCLIKFGLDAQWNRADINEVTSQSVVLTFIDYGFLKSIPYSDIHKLKVIPESLSYLPCLAHCCSLHDT
ncbi:TDR15 protein, partial [Geococcyx californianus]|nr:TDR15 protein [Geococcyx californianus]